MAQAGTPHEQEAGQRVKLGESAQVCMIMSSHALQLMMVLM
jgi:hypothetical protein